MEPSEFEEQTALFHFAAVNRSLDSATPGAISHVVLAELGLDATPLVERLVAAGLWTSTPSGFDIADAGLFQRLESNDGEILAGIVECILSGEHAPDPTSEYCERCAADL